MKVISQYEVNELNAGPKAKVDIEEILNKEFDAKIISFKVKGKTSSKMNVLKLRIKKILFKILNYQIKDVVIYQLPINKNQTKISKTKKSIGIIHDVEGIRHKDKVLLRKEINLYNSLDYIITHNKTMTNYLKKEGLKTPTIELELFDYLVDKKTKSIIENTNLNKEKLISFVGNLNKSIFLSELDEKMMNFQINVYGVGNNKFKNKKICYKGAFSPDELPLKISGDLGLVWDGTMDDNDNNLLNYTKYNNPHKLSCYIAAGIPVIVWRKAAVADFVLENNIGYVISNIYDINNLDFSDYAEKKKNIDVISKKVREGYYTKRVINEIIK